MEETKTCSKCKRKLPATLEYFHKCKDGRLGLNAACKECIHKSHREYDAANKEKIKERLQKNKERRKEVKKEYYIKNKNKLANCKRDNYYENHERYLEYAKQYRENNKEKIREGMRAFASSENGKDRRNISHQKRKALKRQLDYNFTKRMWDECKKHFDNKCAYCGKEEKLTQDHFVPLNEGGEYTRNNILPVCQFCNISKLDRDFFEWYYKQPFYTEEREKKILSYLNYNPKTKHQQLSICL